MSVSSGTKSRAGLVSLLCFALLMPALGNEPSREEAESQLELLRTKIKLLQQSLARSREQYTTEQAELREADLEIQASSLRLHQLQQQRATHESEIGQLKSRRSEYLQELSDSKALLGQQIVSAYQLGRESRLKLLLNQDSPARLSRMLAYYDYFSHAQAEQIRDLRLALATLDRMQLEIDDKLGELAAVQAQQQRELDSLQSRRDERQLVVSGLAVQINSDEKRLTELSRNRRDLEALLDSLSSALEDIPTELGQYVSALKQRGSIPVPISGRVLHAFGQPRLGGLNWQGWLIEAERGSEVQAIAHGRVAFADWLRGYGLLMIIDHGEGIMSLYGNNESLLFEVGDWVQPGSLISTVGDSPGNSQGLYFELRNKGKAVDPAAWLSRR